MEERVYNNLQYEECVISDRGFGKLKQRFPALHYRMRVDREEDPSVITSCVILHNVVHYLKNGSEFDECDNEGGY
jgi:hypothetical protein